MPKEIRNAEIDDGDVTRIEAIIRSMTPAEREEPDAHQRIAPHPHRQGERDEPAGRQRPAAALQGDAETDALGCSWASVRDRVARTKRKGGRVTPAGRH